MANDIWIYAENDGEKVAEVSLELLGEGRKLAKDLGSGVAAVLAGSGVGGLAESLGHYGADTVYQADDPLLGRYNPGLLLEVLSDLISVHQPSVVMFGATPRGRELAPQLATRVKGGFSAECTLLDIRNRSLEVTRPIHDGKLDAKCTFAEKATTRIITVVPGLIGLEKPDSSRKAVVVPVEIPSKSDQQFAVRIVDLIKGDPARIDIREADVIVAAGKGVGGEANFRLVEELASVLQGSVGATRQVVDMGLAPTSRMVGMTGKYVSPRLYVACGISGASQHVQGMRTAKHIVAINTDRNAPIFKVAQTAIIGDLSEVLPQLIEKIRRETQKQGS